MPYRLEVSYREDLRTLVHLKDRHWIITRNDEHYESFPDLCLSTSGKLFCVYREADVHGTWAKEYTRLILIESTDRGRSWQHRRVMDEKTLADGLIWDCPRMSQLSDGRLVIVADVKRSRHATSPEPGRSVLAFWWSGDDGENWSEPHITDVAGNVPDRPLELPNGELLLGATPEFRPKDKGDSWVIYHSPDSGESWEDASMVARDDVHSFTEGSMLLRPDGILVCYLRESSLRGWPSYVSYSQDEGYTWSLPHEAEFFGHRPTAGLLQSGRVLVTYRNVNGPMSTCAWLGDPYGQVEGKVLELDHDSAGSLFDFGYSGWVQFPDEEILCVYYHRGFEERRVDLFRDTRVSKPFLKACRFYETDFGP